MATDRIRYLRPENKPSLSAAQKIRRGLFRVSAVAPWAAASVLLPVLWGLVFGALAIATFDQTLSLPLVFRLFTGTCMGGMVVLALPGRRGGVTIQEIPKIPTRAMQEPCRQRPASA